MRNLIALLMLVSSSSFGQITAAQQKALNNYVDFANSSAAETSTVVASIKSYYERIPRGPHDHPARYVCPVQLEDYYLNLATTESKALNPATATALNARLRALRASAETLDLKCKALDTYHQLGDEKKDNYAGADKMIAEMVPLVADYREKQKALATEIQTTFRKMVPYVEGNVYHKTDAMMRKQIEREAEFINLGKLNLKEDIFTGWFTDKLIQNIAETDAQVKAFTAYKPTVKYPASSMYDSYVESLASVLESKRNALDGFNSEARRSDAHSNYVYMNLINYQNGTLISFYNMFLQYAANDGYRGVKAINFVPAFELRDAVPAADLSVKPYKDIPRVAPPIGKQSKAISKLSFFALNNYIDFINETWQPLHSLQTVLHNLYGDADYFKQKPVTNRRPNLSFNYDNYKLPLSQYQKAMIESKALPPAVAKSLNDELEVLLNIMKELEQISAALDANVEDKKYVDDNTKKIVEMLERAFLLCETFDVKKEQLYDDVRLVFTAYPSAYPTSAWQVSANALQQLMDANHEQLFIGRDYYKGAKAKPNVEKIDKLVREVISNEFTNMKGIEKIGRNNGLCPYTPYEDLPVSSRVMSEYMVTLKDPSPGRTGYSHPYHNLVYSYNAAASYLNKFSELSKNVFVLRTVLQPEFFSKNVYVKRPEEKKEEPVITQTKEQPAVVAEEKTPAVAEKKEPVVTGKDPVSQTRRTEEVTRTETTIRKETVMRDTIYIEKRDTIYISEPNEDLRSMEGYAANNMVLLLDVSGSMNTPDKLPLLKQSVLDMLSMMREEDKVSILAYSGKAKVLLPPTSFKEQHKIKKAIDGLKSSGKTDGNAGIELAYEVADEHYIRAGNNRIILATDGEFTLSDDSRKLIEKFSTNDIFLSVFNFGKGAGSSKALEQLAVLGKGNYSQITRQNVDSRLIREAKGKKKK